MNAAERQRRRSQVVPLVLMGGTIVVGAAAAGAVLSARPRLDPLRPVAGATYRPGARSDDGDEDDQGPQAATTQQPVQQDWFGGNGGSSSGSTTQWHSHSIGSGAATSHVSATSAVSRGGFGGSSHSFGAVHSSGG